MEKIIVGMSLLEPINTDFYSMNDADLAFPDLLGTNGTDPLGNPDDVFADVMKSLSPKGPLAVPEYLPTAVTEYSPTSAGMIWPIATSQVTSTTSSTNPPSKQSMMNEVGKKTASMTVNASPYIYPSGKGKRKTNRAPPKPTRKKNKPSQAERNFMVDNKIAALQIEVGKYKTLQEQCGLYYVKFLQGIVAWDKQSTDIVEQSKKNQEDIKQLKDLIDLNAHVAKVQAQVAITSSQAMCLKVEQNLRNEHLYQKTHVGGILPLQEPSYTALGMSADQTLPKNLTCLECKEKLDSHHYVNLTCDHGLCLGCYHKHAVSIITPIILFNGVYWSVREGCRDLHFKDFICGDKRHKPVRIEELFNKNTSIIDLLLPKTLICYFCNKKVSSVDHSCDEFVCNKCGDKSSIEDALKKHRKAE